MWQPERTRFAGGVAVGVFFAMLPLPFQMLAAAGLAVLTRVNVPAAIAFTWVSNPLTMPLFLFVQYEIGCRLFGREALAMPAGGVIELLKTDPLSLLAGALVTGLVGAFVSYPFSLMGWDAVHRNFERARAKRMHLAEPPQKAE